jgi:predicted TIM-barrel fold metal-dependent hydrolase
VIVDVNTFVGPYPFRYVPGTGLAHLTASMARLGIDTAWVSHLPSVFWRDPMEGNDWLLQATSDMAAVAAVPAIHPGLPGWEAELDRLARLPIPAVRCDSAYYGLDPVGEEVQALIHGCAGHDVPLLAAVRLEDGRQRHPHDGAPELTAAAVRSWLRMDDGARVVVTHADRAFIEEVHFGSTPSEASRVWWDVSWVWGPPEDHLQLLLETVGIDRFVFGTGQPLRLPEAALAKLDLLELSVEDRDRITSGNVLACLDRAIDRR